ncbi:MAG: Gfo/Idh/MocA family protein [Planctomycetota bacterium]
MAEYAASIIGCGGIARLHVRGYKSEQRCRIVGLCDLDEEAAREFRDEHGVDAPIYADYREMLEAEEPDFASICLWPHLHRPVALDCAEAGVRAVHCEKPIAPTWGESLELVEGCREAGVQLTFNHQRRFNHGLMQAKELLEAGRFGELERMDMFAPKHLLDCGTHSLDMGFMFNEESPAAWVAGQVDAREVSRFFDVPCEFMAVGAMKFENGVRGTIHVGDDKEMGTGVRLIGSGGFIEVVWNGSYRRAVCYEEPDWEPPEVEEPDPMPGVMANLVDCLESGEEPELSAEKALRAAEVIFALYESSRRRARIDLPLDARDSAFISMLEQEAIPAG